MHEPEVLSESLVDQSIVALVRDAPAFDVWLRRRVGLAEGLVLCEARRSVWQGTGESDIVIEWSGPEGIEALLIESKVAAGFQKEQGQRYAHRALRLIEEGGYSVCVTALLAPAGYLVGANTEATWFNGRVSIEEVIEAATLHVPPDNHALNTLRKIVVRFDEGGALGTNGLYPAVHQSISRSCELRGNSFRVTNHATDWVFFDHPARVPGLEIRYRIKSRIVELAFTPAFKSDVDQVMKSLGPPLVATTSGGYSFVRLPALDAIPLEASLFSPADAEVVVDSLEHLMSWWVGPGSPKP